MLHRAHLTTIVTLLLLSTALPAQSRSSVNPYFLGFDRNEYPGDNNLKELRKTFAYTGYWLNNPPGAATNTWVGKRATVESMGFGFLVLFNGRLHAEMGDTAHATRLGRSDAQQAIESAKHEGFSAQTIIFLDQEEGGRLLPEQKAYLFAWVDAINQSGFRAGVYCSGIVASEAGGATIITAEDIGRNAGNRKVAFWVTNDACPPSPGCSIIPHPPSPGASGIAFADIWQFAQSPKRKDVASACRGYDTDNNCYDGSAPSARIHLDLNTATSPDPSHGRSR